MTMTGKAKLAGVMGWPVAHSRSPQLHGYWLEQYGIDGAYVPLPVRPEDFDAALRALPMLGFRGANVTVPHKQAALAAVDITDDAAQRIGAVNTVVVTEDGRLEGRNTDAYGFMESLHEQAPAFDPTHGPAVVLGAGGAARAIVVALADARSPEIRVINRTTARADALIRDIGSPSVAVDLSDMATALGDAALFVNATSLGMSGQPPLELDLAPLSTDAAVVDIVYEPLETALLSQARKRGNPAVDGLGMLLHQARPAFEAWFGVAPDVTDALRAAVLRPGKG